MADKALRDGFEAFKELMFNIKTLSNDTVDPEAEEDTRDYFSMFDAVVKSINSNVVEAVPMHREGFLRSLTDLLCMSSDGVTPGENWDPIKTTAPTFAEREPFPVDSTIQADRAGIALQASWEIEGIADLVHANMTTDVENLVHRALLRRCKRLSSVIMSALGEPAMDCATLESMLLDGM